MTSDESNNGERLEDLLRQASEVVDTEIDRNAREGRHIVLPFGDLPNGATGVSIEDGRAALLDLLRRHGVNRDDTQVDVAIIAALRITSPKGDGQITIVMPTHHEVQVIDYILGLMQDLDEAGP